MLHNKIKYTKHARERMIERGISEKEVVTAINKGSKSHNNKIIVSTYTYFRVVYKKVKNNIYVITVELRW